MPKTYVVVFYDKTESLATANCADLNAIDKLLEEQSLNADDVFVFTSQPIEIRRALTVQKAPRKIRASKPGLGKKPPSKTPNNGSKSVEV